jgi:hypothetical protein
MRTVSFSEREVFPTLLYESECLTWTQKKSEIYNRNKKVEMWVQWHNVDRLVINTVEVYTKKETENNWH